MSDGSAYDMPAIVEARVDFENLCSNEDAAFIDREGITFLGTYRGFEDGKHRGMTRDYITVEVTGYCHMFELCMPPKGAIQ